MRKEALARLASFRVSVTFLRSDVQEIAPDLDLDDRVRVLLPGKRGEPMKPALCRVEKIEEMIHGDDGETVTLTLSIPTGTGGSRKARPAALDGYGGREYFGEPEYLQGGSDWMTAGDDIEWTYEADDVVSPVDPRLLSSPLYSLLDHRIEGTASEQLAEYERIAMAGGEPDLTMVTPTKIGLVLRPIVSEGLLELKGRAEGVLLFSPCGMNFSKAGEPNG
jgi:hypothetical protein